MAQHIELGRLRDRAVRSVATTLEREDADAEDQAILATLACSTPESSSSPSRKSTPTSLIATCGHSVASWRYEPWADQTYLGSQDVQTTQMTRSSHQEVVYPMAHKLPITFVTSFTAWASTTKRL